MLTNKRTPQPCIHKETFSSSSPASPPSLLSDKTSRKYHKHDASNEPYEEASHTQEPPISSTEQPLHSLSLDDPRTPTSLEPPRHSSSFNVPRVIVEPPKDDLPADDAQKNDASEQEPPLENRVPLQDIVFSDDLNVQENTFSGTISLTEHVDHTTSSEESTDRQESDSEPPTSEPTLPTPDSTTETDKETQLTSNATTETDKETQLTSNTTSESDNKTPTVKPYSLKTQTTKVNFPPSNRFPSPKSHEFPSRFHEGGIGYLRPSNNKYGFSMNKYASGPPIVPRPSMPRRTVSFPTPADTSIIMNQDVDPTVVKTSKGEITISDPLPLYNSWSFLYTAPKENERTDSQRDWEMDIKTVVDKISTVQQFCRMWNYASDLREPSRLPFGSNMFFFRSGVKPAWEDPQNVGGGKISLQAENRDFNVADLWRDILLDIVGATLPHPEAICGVVLNHKDQDRFDIWLTRAAFNRKYLTEIGEEIRAKLSKNFPMLRCWQKPHPSNPRH